MSHIELIRSADGPVEIRLAGLVTAAEQRIRRWRAAVYWGLLLLTMVLAGMVSILALRWDALSHREILLLQADQQYLRVEKHCWRMVALHAPTGIAEIIPLAQREMTVRQCVLRELQRGNK